MLKAILAFVVSLFSRRQRSFEPPPERPPDQPPAKTATATTTATSAMSSTSSGTSGYRLSDRSKQRLATCHRDLQWLIKAVIADPRCPMDFTVLEGHRSIEQQRRNLANGASKTMRSRHLFQPSLAVDIAPFIDGSVSWAWPHYHTLAPVVKEIAEDLGIDIEWGGDWESFKDGPHWQLKCTITDAEWRKLGV